MTGDPELKITSALLDSFRTVLGREPTEAEPVVILAAYVHRLADGHGLSDSADLAQDPVEFAGPPAAGAPLITHFLPEACEPIDGEALRDRLYSVVVELADDVSALRQLHSAPLTGEDLLKVAQIFWNLTGTATRRRLPIRPGKINVRGALVAADIPVPGKSEDFARWEVTKRTNEGARLGAARQFRSSQFAFRKMVARLAVLVAEHLVASGTQPAPTTAGADLTSSRGRTSIVWPTVIPEPIAPPEVTEHDAVGEPTEGAPPDGLLVWDSARLATAPVLVGWSAAVGPSYQRRVFEDELDRLWSAGNDRRVWLRGGPGVGKSYTARRIVQDAVTHQEHDRADLLIWVDSASPESVTQAFSEAVDRMPHLGIKVPRSVPDRMERQARALVGVLATSTWRWLIVMDNADASALIESGLIPTGGNPNGRVLITTVRIDHRMAGYGHLVRADQFTLDEAEAFLRAQVDAVGGGPADLARACASETASLAAAVGHHPLALSIAAATIVRHGMDIRDWITEFQSATAMDRAADARDAGGYPHLIGATWRLALAKASQGLPDGLVERAAMVAALQDPDGHPTWVWDDAGVVGWVAAGATLDRDHGVPRPLERLADYGIIERRGQWRHGVVTIHQLAARAVRELADADVLVDLASVLVDAWLLHLSDDETGTRASLRRNLEPLANLPGLSDATQQAVAALLAFASPPSDAEYESHEQTKREIATYLARGGSTGREYLAYQLDMSADYAAELGRLDEAQAKRIEAVQHYRQLADDPATTREQRASHLYRLGKLHEKLGQTEQSREAFTRAREVYQTLSDADGLVLFYLVELTDIHEALGDHNGLGAVLARAGRAIDATADGSLVAEMRDPVFRRHWSDVAENFRSYRQLAKAERILTLMVEALQQSGQSAKLSNALRRLVRIHTETGRWEQAADTLNRVVTGHDNQPDDLVLLASIQLHLGRRDDAAKSVASASTVYQSREHHRTKTPVNSTRYRDAAFVASLSGAALDAQRRGRWGDVAGLSEGLVHFHGERTESNPGEHKQEKDLAHGNLWLALARLQTGQPGEAVGPLARAVNIYQLVSELNPDDHDAQSGLADALTLLADAHRRLNHPDEAADHLGRAISLAESMPDPDSADRQAQDRLAGLLVPLGTLSVELGEFDEAERLYKRLVDIRFATVKLHPGSVAALRDLASAEDHLGSVAMRLGRPDTAEEWLAFAVNNRQELVNLDPDDRAARRELAETLTRLAIALGQLERIDEAERALNRAVEINRELTDSNPDDHDAQRALAFNLAALGSMYRAADRLEEATACQMGATNILLLLIDLAPNPEPKVVQTTIALLRELAETLRFLGRIAEADTVNVHAEDLATRFPETPFDEDL